jgi:hypothetical protein
VLVLVSGTIAYATLSKDGAAESPRAAVAAGKSPPRLKASGKVTGLYPGAVRTMKVRIRNRYADPIRLGYVKTKARDASPGCTSQNLAVTPRKRTRKVIPARRFRAVRVRVEMAPSAAPDCQGARFPLRFVVRGRRL